MNLMDLFIKIGVKDEASDRISNITSKIGSGLKTAAKVGAAAVGAAGTAVVALAKQSIDAFAEYEQLAGGVEKIFDQMDTSTIFKDANDAYKNLNMSANEYLSIVNSLGAAFASTMGDQKGYDTAKQGLQAISDYASGTGRSIDELSEKYQLITRSSSSYQSIADQFSGILPATSAAFLEQAKAAGLLSESYEELTDVPIDEYQEAVTKMLAQGVDALGLTNNTVNEAFNTISGSLAATKSAWQDVITSFSMGGSDLSNNISKLVKSASALFKNLLPVAKDALNGISTLIQELGPVIIQELPGLIDQVVPPLITAATSLIEELSNVLPELAVVLTDQALIIIKQLATALTQNIDVFMGAGQEIIQSLANALIDNMDLLLDSALEIIISLGEGLIASIDTLAETAGSIIESFAEFISEEGNLQSLIDVALDLLSAIVDGIGQNIDTLADAAVTIISTLVTTLLQEENITKIMTVAGDIVATLAKGIIAAPKALLDAAMSIITNIGTALETASTSLNTVIGRVVSNIAISFVTKIGELFHVSDEIISSIVDGINAKIGVIEEAGQQSGQGIVDGAESKTTEAQTSGDALAGSILDGISAKNSNFTAEGVSMGTLFASAFRGKSGDALSAGTTVSSSAASGLKSNNSSAYTWGVDMVQNYINGMYSQQSALNAAAQSLAGTVEANLGFSEPEEGPLSNFHTFAPDMIDLWNETLAANDYKLRDQIQKSFDFRDIIDGATSTFSFGGVETEAKAGFSIVQNFYNNDRPTAADLMEEATYNARQAVLFGV